MKQADDCLLQKRNEGIQIKCLNPEVICAHSFQEKCIAKEYKHLCQDMRDNISKCKLSEVLGN